MNAKHPRRTPARAIAMRRFVAVAATATIATLALGGSAALAAEPTPFSNGFETDTTGWFDATRVDSGTNGVTSRTGSHHAEDVGGNAFTRWGGYSSTFPAGGYTTSVDVYLQPTCPADDTRFDWTSAINDATGNHRRDFVFNGGCYTAGGDHFTISASTNAGRGSSFPANPGNDPVTISTAGWYTFKHRFYNNAGTLAVDLSIVDSAGTTVKTWTRSDPTDAISGIGGNRYGWFAQNEFSFLAFDNSRLTVTAPDCDAVIDKTAATWKLTHDCTTDHTIAVPSFDGQNHTITAVDPSVGHFLGAVLTNVAGAAPVTIANTRVTTSSLTDICDGGNDRLRGIFLDGAAGAITNNTVTHLNQGRSGCQEGNAIEARWLPLSTSPRKVVTISGNTVSDYQKNGITANGQVTATITNNTVTGAGPIDYIAQNGIQVGFGAAATVKGNSSSGNDYTPASDTACGLLIFQADGVKASGNTLFANERDQCNFGKGNGPVKPSA
jgi:hypothetical protein